MCTKLAGFNCIGNHTSSEYCGVIQLQASTGGGVGTGVTSFSASANQNRLGGSSNARPTLGPKPWYPWDYDGSELFNLSLMFQADVSWIYPSTSLCVHVAGFTPQTATFHSSLQLGKHSSETSQELEKHSVLPFYKSNTQTTYKQASKSM